VGVVRKGLVAEGEAVEASGGSYQTGVNGAVDSPEELPAASKISWLCLDLLVSQLPSIHVSDGNLSAIGKIWHASKHGLSQLPASECCWRQQIIAGGAAHQERLTKGGQLSAMNCGHPVWMVQMCMVKGIRCRSGAGGSVDSPHSQIHHPNDQGRAAIGWTSKKFASKERCGPLQACWHKKSGRT
jgi:hypothetical protein